MHDGLRPDLDQCPSTTATVLKRLALLKRHEPARSIAFIGDDDLCSLAVAAANARARITVLDVDDRLLRTLRSFPPSQRIEAVRHDVRLVLPPRLRSRFDDVFTDPPYTLAGQLVFVRAAALALRREPGASLYVCASRAYLDATQLRRVRGYLGLAGFALHSHYPALNRYRAPIDVRRDLQRFGCRSTTWLESDLFHYVRHRIVQTPRLPPNTVDRIYDY